MSRSVYLSLVIPAYNEAHRLPRTLPQVTDFLEKQPYAWEVLVVDNGSTDDTLRLVQEFSRKHPQVRALHTPLRGKGRAVKLGMLAARGEWRFLADADFSMPVTELPRFLPPQAPEADILIGSREAPGAVRYHEPWHRHLIGRVFNLMVQVAALPGIRDSQCGFKNFRGDVAERLFRCQRIAGMSFDVEILFIARRWGYRIVEVPIPWYFDPDSRVRLVHDSLRMAWDLLTIRLNALRGLYEPSCAHMDL